jgi:hypothetical protein
MYSFKLFQIIVSVFRGSVVIKGTLTVLGRIVTKYFGLTVTPEIFESELEHIMSIKDVSEYIEGMKSQLPSAEELAALAEIVKRKNW